MNKASQDKLIKDLFKVATFVLALKGVKIFTDKYCWTLTITDRNGPVRCLSIASMILCQIVYFLASSLIEVWLYDK